MDKLTRTELDAALNWLEATLPTWVRQHSQSDAMEAFDIEAKEIEIKVSDADLIYFRSRIERMLRNVGLISGSDESAEQPAHLELPDNDAGSQ